MTNYVLYDGITGRIWGQGYFTEGTLEDRAVALGQNMLEGDCNIATHYVDLGTLSIVPRPEMNVSINKLSISADNTDACILLGLPIPCQILIEDAGTFTIDDGEFGFTTPLPGNYKITAEQFPFISKIWEVQAI